MCSKKPFFSIITVVLNNKNGLESTIQSMRKQGKDDFEYIIIDGGSTDGTLEVIDNNKDLIDLCVSEGGNGIFPAMNRGLGLCRGRYIGFINSGDTYQPYVLAEVKNVAKKNRADILYGNLNLVEMGKTIATLNGSKHRLFWDMSINHPACFIKKEVHCSNPFYENYKLAADYELMLRLKKQKCNFVKIDKVISEMVTGGASSNVQLSIFERKEIHQTYYGKTYANFRHISSILKMRFFLLFR